MCLLWQKVPNAFETSKAPAHSHRREAVFLRNLLQGIHTVDPSQESYAIFSPSGIHGRPGGRRSSSTASTTGVDPPSLIGTGVVCSEAINLFDEFFFLINSFTTDSA